MPAVRTALFCTQPRRLWRVPDGLIGDVGFEIKRPNTAAHIETLLTGRRSPQQV